MNKSKLLAACLAIFTLTSAGNNTGQASCDGSAGACACSAVGAVDHGCPNSAGPNGGHLIGLGNAALSADTFGLAATSCPPGQVGVVISGTQDFSPGISFILDSAGLLCLGGITQRGAATYLDANGSARLPRFQGLPYGNSSLVSAGTTIYYQFQYRDPNTVCAALDTPAADFNFTNMWEVSWMP